ncbi:MAG: DedA family protein [Gemmatimonadota bacterium]
MIELMDTLLTLIEHYGLVLLFAVGFAEYTGVPIASVPVILAAALGGLTADALWYTLARHRGERLVNAACSLSPNPRVCIGKVQARVTQLGAPYIITAKFLPGVGNLIAPAAGLGEFPALRFLALDFVALLLWANVYAGIGWVFSNEVESLIMLAQSYTRWILVVAVALIATGGTYRHLKKRWHAAAHAAG